jgi:hypothetical protein
MAAKKNNIGRIDIAKLGAAAMAARENRYLQRLIEDRELRDTLRGAYVAARGAYGRMNNGKAPTKALLDDRRLQRELAVAAGALRDVSSALREGPGRSKARRRRGRMRRTAAMVIVGAALALVLSKDLRSKVLDMVFGSEEEFSYSSTTAPPVPAPEPAASSSP